MSLQQGFRVLFVGERQKGEALRERAGQRGVHLGIAPSVTDTTGLYLLLAPDIVVLDSVGSPDLAREAHLHLSSVGARPLVVITENIVDEEWKEVAGGDTILLGSPQSHDGLLEDLAGIVEKVPSLFAMDTHLEVDPEYSMLPEARPG